MQVLKPKAVGRRFGWLATVGRGRGAAGHAEALERLLAPVLDDAYVLVLAPQIPGVDHGLHGLLVGPGGVRALLVRNWHGQFRQRGRLWEFNARGRRGWVACRTDPTRDAKRIVDQVGTWMKEALGTQFPIEATIAFPDRRSQVELLDNPVTEVVTLDNAPWWANRLTRIRRLDGRSAGRLLEALGV
jgi:hypothetical protein